MTVSRNILWLAPLLLLVVSPIWLPSIVRFLAPPEHISSARSEESSTGGFSMTGVTVTRSVEGSPEAILSAARVESGRWDHNDYSMQDVDALFFEKGTLKAHVLGGEGYYDVTQRILTLVDDVSIVVDNKYELKTQALRYLLPYKTIKTAVEILFESPEMVIQGTGMQYNIATGDYRVGGRVQFDIR